MYKTKEKGKKRSNGRSRISSNDKEMIRKAMMVPVLIQSNNSKSSNKSNGSNSNKNSSRSNGNSSIN